MKRIYSGLLLSLSSLPLLAGTISLPPVEAAEQTESDASLSADSVSSVDLQEVVVQGRTQRVIKYGVEYIPDKKTKRNAMDAVSLLQRMQIPQLYVDPFTKDVSTAAREDVKFFIDYHPASSDQIAGLRPEDVLRVEVLDYPQDPRFNSAPHVINFIMQKYEWGGYTRVGVSPHFLADNYYGAGVFSRFVYKKMTYDARVGGGGGTLKRMPESSFETYRDIDFLGHHYDEITRSNSTDYYNNKINSLYASFSAAYNNNSNTYIQHALYFNRYGNPFTDVGSSMSLSVPGLSDTNSLSKSSSQNLSPTVTGNYWFGLPKQNYLSLNWTFAYTSAKRYSDYQVDGLPSVVNNNLENVYAPSVQAFYTKVLPKNNTLRAMLYSYATFYNTKYAGSFDRTQNILSNENMLFLEYFKNWDFGLNLYGRVGASYVVGRINGVNTLQEWNPRLGMQLNYKFNDKHSLGIDGWWGNSHPDPATASEALVQSNELLWLQGNPDLRNTLFASSNLSYNFIPTNKFSMAATLSYEGNPHRQAYLYYTLPGHDGLVRKTVNSGSANDVHMRVSATLRLLDNSLSFSADGLIGRIVLSGIDGRGHNYLSGNVNAQYMRDNWSVSLYYRSPSSYMGAWSNSFVVYNQDNYGASFTYNVADFKASLSFNNWFRKDYKNRTVFNSERFSSVAYGWASNLSRIIYIDLSYTFPYGKKVSRNNENSGGGSTGSAILK